MSDIFVSHVREDVATALDVVLGLEERGYTTWCRELDIPPAGHIIDEDEKIRARQMGKPEESKPDLHAAQASLQAGRAIEQAKAFILLVSPNSLRSHEIGKEVFRAYFNGKQFVLMLWNVTNAEFQKSQPEWAEAVKSTLPILIPPSGVGDVLDLVINQLESVDIRMKSTPDSERINRIRSRLPKMPSRITQSHPIKTNDNIKSTIVEAKTTETQPKTFKRAKNQYSTILRVISGIFGFSVAFIALVLSIVSIVEGEVDVRIYSPVNFVIAAFYFLLAFAPYWVTTRLKINLRRHSIFILKVIALIFLWILALTLIASGAEM